MQELPRRRALISVTDKTGVVDFATGLADLNFEIVSTGGTAVVLREAGLEVIDVASVTGFPEGMDGRIKTLDPHIFGGILAADKPSHQEYLDENRIGRFDLVVVNLYNFAGTTQKPGITHDQIIEQIDIGGPSAIRAAAKNYLACAPVVNPEEYGQLLDLMQGRVREDPTEDFLGLQVRKDLQKEAFQLTADYDRVIAAYLVSVS